MVDETELDQIIRVMKPSWERHPFIIFVKDAEGVYKYVNPAFYELTGFSPDEVLGKIGFEIFDDDPDLSQEYYQADLEVLQEGIEQDYQTTVERQGEEFHSHTLKTPLIGSKGDIIGIYGESRDISALVNARIKLKVNLNLLETTMDAVPYPIFVKDINFRYTRVNQAFLDEVEMTRDELYGKTDTDIYGKNRASLFESKDNEVIQKGKRVIYITDRINGNDDPKKFMIIKDPLFDDKGIIIGIVGIIDPTVNISDIQEQLINQQKIEAISLMAGGIAHDLNNMLTSIKGISSVLREDALSESTLKMVDTIFNASIEASNLIKKLLTFSKKSPDQTTSIDLVDQITSVITLVLTNIPSRISLSTNLPDEKVEIRVDQTQISQLILNLVLNAVEAIEGHGSIIVRLDTINLQSIRDHEFILIPGEFEPGMYANIQVQDSGSGISEANINKIFDPFFTTKDTGTGLGLPVVYGVISSHSGLLRIDTKRDDGTLFDIYLPLNQN